jgi:hypothetical protein
MKLTEEQFLKLSRAQGLIVEVQNELMRLDELKPMAERTEKWRGLQSAYSSLTNFVELAED